MDYEKVTPENKRRNKTKIIVFTAIASLLVVTTVVAVTVTQSKNNHHHHNAVIRSTCAATLYPELCISTVTAAATSRVTTSKDVLITALNLTINVVEHNYFSVQRIRNNRNSSLTARERIALHDCLEMIDDTIEELRESEMELRDFGLANYTISQHTDNILNLLSACQTNQETCVDGFSHGDADRHVRETLLAGQRHVIQLVSNVMAIIKNLSDTEMASLSVQKSTVVPERKLEEDNNEWPEWMSAEDRRLLQSTTITPDVTVAADGSGNFRTIAAAVAAAPEGRTTRYVIRIRAGTYRENVEIPRRKTFLMFLGDGRTTTIITGSRSVGGGSTTFNSATVAVIGNNFLARDITFQNTAGASNNQAVALRVNADLCAFYQCNMLAYQDTLYVHSLRQFYTGCLISGTVDFIFGNAAAVFQNCDIHARRPNSGQRNMLTAQGRDDPNQNTGIVIQRCRIAAASDLRPVQANFPTYLGRPWREYSRTVIMQSTISDVINPAGWFMWDGNFALSTLFYAEYQNTGAGAPTGNRVTWSGYRVLTTTAQVTPFTAGNFIGGGNWLSATTFPFSLGL